MPGVAAILDEDALLAVHDPDVVLLFLLFVLGLLLLCLVILVVIEGFEAPERVNLAMVEAFASADVSTARGNRHRQQLSLTVRKITSLGLDATVFTFQRCVIILFCFVVCLLKSTYYLFYIFVIVPVRYVFVQLFQLVIGQEAPS